MKGAADRLLMMAAIRLVGLLYGLAVLPFVPWPDHTARVWLFLACGANFAYHGFLIQSYRVGDLSLVYPLSRGSAPILLAVMAAVAAEEHLTLSQIAAVMLITGGILALVIETSPGKAAIGFALATGASIAAYSFFGGVGVRSSASVLGFHAWLEILTGLGVLTFAGVVRQGRIRSFVQTSGGVGFFAGALSVAGYLIFLLAAKVLPIALVAALRETSLIFGTVIGALVLNEPFGARRVVAAGLVLCGVIALAAGALR